jgi:threonine/homoserine/homoserine lactone efflux protein
LLLSGSPGGEDSNIVDLSPFVRGLALGLALAAPVGPMSLLCMRRTLAGGFPAGLVSGLGIASADALYGAVAAFGLVAITDLLLGQQLWLRVAGGAFVVYLGLTTIRARPPEATPVPSGGRLAGLYSSIFVLTLTNPSTILTFVALFAGLGVGSGTEGIATPLATVAGVFVGSAVWWLVLTGGVALTRGRLADGAMRLVNGVCGLALVGFGIVAVLSWIVSR